MVKMISLFSGVGGFDWGFKQYGVEILFANDIRSEVVRAYADNYGLKPVVCDDKGVIGFEKGKVLNCDINKVDFMDAGDVDIVIGGPPCQDFTTTRGPKRMGIMVERGRLYQQYVRVLKQVGPKIFVFENVPGLMTANDGLAFKTILKDFRELNDKRDGYEILFADVIDSSKHGVPQARKRLIILGVRRDLINKGELLLLRGIVNRLYGSGVFKEYPLTPMEVFTGRIIPELQDEYVEIIRKWDGVWLKANTKRAWEWKKMIWDRLSFNAVRDYLFFNQIGIGRYDGLEDVWRNHRSIMGLLGYHDWRVCSDPRDRCDDSMIRDERVRERMMMIPFGENKLFLMDEREGLIMSFNDRRIHMFKPSITILASTRIYHYDRDRFLLRLAEEARLQTFPRGFIFRGNASEVLRQIGEAVPPLLSYRIAGVVGELLRRL